MALLRLLTLCLAFEAAFTLECGEFTGSGNILQTRIVNGELASLGEFPWQISMQRRVRPKVAGVQNGPATASSDVVDILTEEEVLDNSIWGRFLWGDLAAEKNVSFDQIANWPPPLPTHPPHHTIPPLPTHPPNHRPPSFPPMPPMPTFPPGIGNRPWSPPPHPWPPAPQRPTQYPPLPTLPPSRPNPFPTYPPPSRPNPLPTSPPSRPNPLPTQPPSRPNPLPTQPPNVKPPRPRPPIDKTQKWQHFCGGSIIDSNWILTAAHCVESMKHTYTPGTIRIVAGSLDWRNIDEKNAQVIPVDRIVVHNGWTQQSGQNDVALLHLQSPIEYVQEPDRIIVNKICLSHVMNQEHSGMATSSGWGFLSKDQRVTPDLMRRVDLPVVDHNTCRNAFSRVIGVTQMQVCAGQAPRGNCMGDSGGPLVQKVGNKATQIGIVSFSIPCAVPGYPDVFTRVSKYLDWIITNTGLSV